MSNSDIDRAINFLHKGDNSLLPGFETPEKTIPTPPNDAATTTEESPAVNDSFAPPPDADAPPLPGLAMPEENQPPVIHHKLEKTILELHPPAQKRAEQAVLRAGTAKPAARFSSTVALGAFTCILGICLIVACICLLNSSEAPVASCPNGIPLALLPDAADPTLWETVSRMSGEIDGAPLAFDRGIATDVNGRTYKLQLDFCRKGPVIYAKVTGDKTYVVCLDSLGRITKVYPAPKNNKPLKEIFGR